MDTDAQEKGHVAVEVATGGMGLQAGTYLGLQATTTSWEEAGSVLPEILQREKGGHNSYLTQGLSH